MEGTNDGKGRRGSHSGVGEDNYYADVTVTRKLSRTRDDVASTIDDLVEVGKGGGGCHTLGGGTRRSRCVFVYLQSDVVLRMYRFRMCASVRMSRRGGCALVRVQSGIVSSPS